MITRHLSGRGGGGGIFKLNIEEYGKIVSSTQVPLCDSTQTKAALSYATQPSDIIHEDFFLNFHGTFFNKAAGMFYAVCNRIWFTSGTEA
jgi:hypothetical protein